MVPGKKTTIICQKPLRLQSLVFHKTLRLLIMAPHPDDFDAIGLTMRFFHNNGNSIQVAVATTGANGVEDTFSKSTNPDVNTKIREQEQLASCRFFGLPEANLTFLRLEEDKAGHLVESEVNRARIRALLEASQPALVFLPHWNDTNLAHQRVYTIFRRAALEASLPVAAFLNRDPKTIQMRCDLLLGFEEEAAAWKGELLRFHQSQHQRNLNQRGHGMDERILRLDRENARRCNVSTPYAEVFELELYGAKSIEDILIRYV